MPVFSCLVYLLFVVVKDLDPYTHFLNFKFLVCLPFIAYRIGQILAGENFGEFGELKIIRQYFTQPNLSIFL